jgi:HlyD family secretion protein
MDKFWTFRTAEFQVNKAQVAVENAQNAAGKTAIALENAKTARAKADNDVAIAQNNLNIARDTLQKAIITAPFDGVIAAVNVKVFDLLSSATYATTTAIEIIDSSRMELNININELDIPNVKVGQKVTITVDALPGLRVDGTVSAVGTLPAVESGLVSFTVKVVFNMPQNSGLKAGMNARADIVTDKR